MDSISQKIGNKRPYKKTDAICLYCKQPIKMARLAHQKYCSKQCATAFQTEKTNTLNKRQHSTKLTPGTHGAMSELIASTDLMRLGYHVFRAISPSCPCDLIAMLNGVVLRIEVRTALVNMNGTISFPKNSLATHEYDVLALVLYDSDVQYIPDLTTF